MTHTNPSHEQADRRGSSRSGGILRGLGVTALVLIVIVAAVFGGLVTTAGFQLWDRARGTGPRTVTRLGAGVVVAVRELSRLETTTFHMERVIDHSEKQERLFGLLRTKDAILLVAAADVSAGVDLSKLTEGDVVANPDERTIRIVLPPPEVLSTRLDTRLTYVHTRSTDVLARRQEALESEARVEAAAALRESALEAGILEHARQSAERTLRSLLGSFGYETVEIRWKDR